MRKYRRYQLHVQARREGAKEGPYVRRMWDRYQAIRYGAKGRDANRKIGTKKKRNWGSLRHAEPLGGLATGNRQ